MSEVSRKLFVDKAQAVLAKEFCAFHLSVIGPFGLQVFPVSHASSFFPNILLRFLQCRIGECCCLV